MGYDERRGSFGIEALFLGGMAVLVVGIALFAMTTTSFGGHNVNGGANSGGTNVSIGASTPAAQTGTVSTVINAQGQRDVICACYNEGFELAGKTSDVQSTTYRTGFSQCRALGDVAGGDAWTAGWDARRSGRAYEATCKAYKRRAR